MEDIAKKAKKEYQRTWREKNKEHIKDYKKRWSKENPEKIKTYQDRYWLKRALES